MPKQGNISILVIFLLLAASFLGLLTMYYVQQLLGYQDLLLGYYQSYYLAKGGVELGIGASNARGVGLQYSYDSTSQTGLIKHFSCGTNCDLQLHIRGTDDYLYNFTGQQSSQLCRTLADSEIFIQPLFHDQSGTNLASLFTQQAQYQSLRSMRNYLQFYRSGTNTFVPHVILGLISLSGDTVYQDSVIFKDYIQMNSSSLLSHFFQQVENHINQSSVGNIAVLDALKPSAQQYLVIANADNKDVDFCLRSSSPGYGQPAPSIPSDHVFIQSQARYKNYQVSLDALVQKSIPQYLIQTYIDL